MADCIFVFSPTLSVRGAEDGFSVRMMSPIWRFMSSPSLIFVSARIAVTVSLAESRCDFYADFVLGVIGLFLVG